MGKASRDRIYGAAPKKQAASKKSSTDKPKKAPASKPTSPKKAPTQK
jgi:hypothetical protein